MNFQVPQFIEIEDRIFGPLTFKQFLYLAGSGGLAFIFYALLPIYLAIIPMIIIIAFGLALAFYQVNNRPFIHVVEMFFRYLLTAKLYIWRKSEKIKTKSVGGNKENSNEPALPRLSNSRLEDLSWNLDVKEKVK
ncbi:MAG: PrgI family protein [Candidatus Paceibacterota bacterium]